jgi:hypothetical protein
MICDNCTAAAKKAESVFTVAERMYTLAASVAMLRSILAAPTGNDRANDLKVSSSVITKLILSFPESGRETLIKHFKQTTGIEITLGDCPHGKKILPA